MSVILAAFRAWEDTARATHRVANGIPMRLLQDNYISQYGGKLKEGTEVFVDRQTAERWVRNGVALPGPTAAPDVQRWAAQRFAERKVLKERASYDLDAQRAWDAFRRRPGDGAA